MFDSNSMNEVNESNPDERILGHSGRGNNIKGVAN